MPQLNQYRDQFKQTTGSHGLDISSQRIDELDQQALEYALQHQAKSLKGMDIGCGSGIQGIRFALLNAEMELVDILDIEERIKRISRDLHLGHKLRYLKRDVKNLKVSQFDQKYDFIYTQRFLHYLNYGEACGFISFLSEITGQGGKLFISASGISSELAVGYAGGALEISNRFFRLSPKMAEKHGIYEQVCLYSEDELGHLLTSHGYNIQALWTSPFGNIKAIGQKQ